MLIRYLLLWFVLAVVAVINGLVREATYGQLVGELAAHRISTITAILASGAVVWIASRAWPLDSAPRALAVGALWLVSTVSFEFVFGHYVAGHDWGRLLRDYDVSGGRLWPLFLLWLFALPYLAFMLRRR